MQFEKCVFNSLHIEVYNNTPRQTGKTKNFPIKFSRTRLRTIYLLRSLTTYISKTHIFLCDLGNEFDILLIMLVVWSSPSERRLSITKYKTLRMVEENVI